MIFKCPQCKKESDYLDVEVTDVYQYGTIFLSEENEDIIFGSLDTNHDDSQDFYYCPNCGHVLPMHDEESLTDYLRKENQDG